jgi:hypothetical protein
MPETESISYEGWLNEKKLVDTLTAVVSKLNGELLPCGYGRSAKRYRPGTQIKLPGSRSRFDFGFLFDNQGYLVEFDGNYQGVGHYNNAQNCYKDDLKNALAELQGFKIIRVPYWLQLDNQTFEVLFNFESPCNIENNFPHGFITNSSLNPASFCELGMKRFNRELNLLPDAVRFDVLVSLRVKSDRLGIPLKYVWDSDLLNDIENQIGYQEKYDEVKRFADEFNND